MERTSIILLIIAGIIILAGAFIEASASGTNPLGASREITCDVKINAQLKGAFDITEQPTCVQINTCTISPLKGLFIGDIAGKLRIVYNGKAYAEQDISKNVLATASNFQITACVPADATNINVQVFNSQGGKDDDYPTNIK